jgi:cell pole-organizing protein PopZ
MSSFDKTAGKNLDEILASIRRTLADESTQPDAAQPLVQANSSASLAGNGSPVAPAKIDDDFADLLAGGLGTTPVPSAGTEAADGAPAHQKDPLWFLRPSAREPQVLPLPPDRTLPSLDGLADSGIPPPQRSSFEPQFISDSHGGDVQPAGASSTSPASPGQAATSPAPATEPRTISKSKPANGLAPEATGPASAKGSDGAELGSAAAAPPSDPAGAANPEEVSPANRQAEVKAPAAAAKADGTNLGGAPGGASATAGSPSPVVRPEAVPVKPDPGQQQAAAKGNPASPADAGKPAAAAPATATPSRFGGGPTVSKTASTPARATGLNGAGAAGASAAPPPAGAKAVPTSQTQAIEQIIEQLLEPVLHRWVEAKLPRLVETAIRAEVARILENKSANGHEGERKL